MNGFDKSHAVVIGINEYSNGIPRLQTAVNDAEKIGEILSERFGYDVQTLTTAVTKARLCDQFADVLPKKVAENDRLLIYFAGHGIALEGDDGPAGYLIPQDAKRDDRGTFVPMTDLNGWLHALPCRHLLLVLDCCFAGAFRWASTRDMGPPPGEIYKERYDRFINDPAWQVLTSAAHDQKALDTLGERGTDKKLTNHSPFAASLIRGLTGQADAYPKKKEGEKSGDGVITASELYMFLRDEVEVSAEAIHHSQTPGLWPLKKHDRGEYIHLIPGYELNLKPAPKLDENANPYRGLQSYDIEHASLFFGRKAVVQKLARRVEDQPLTLVLGASGTGKSSVVKSGLVSYLRNPDEDSTGPGKSAKKGHDSGPPIDRYAILKAIRPGKSPLASLTDLAFAPEKNGGTEPTPDSLKTTLENLKNDPAALSATIGAWLKANAKGKMMLIVDQFEELITLCSDEAERKQFLEQLKKAIEKHTDRLRVIVTLRSDFEPQFVEFEAFAKSVRTLALAGKTDQDAITGPNFIVPAMTPEEYREVIEGPASVCVLYFKANENRTSQDFIDRLIGDIANTPGALPLLSFTLSELYRSYVQSGLDDRALQEADYDTLGGVGGALRQRANEIYDKLPDDAHRETMKKVMLRMVSAEGGGLARRRATRDELVYASDAENQRVETILSELVSARLVIQDKDEEDRPFLEPAHDKLVNGWSRLLEWARNANLALQLRDVLAPAVEDWARDEKKDKGKLWSDNPRLSLLAEELGLPNRWYSYQYHKLKAFYEREAESELIEFEIPSWMKRLTPKIESKPTWLNTGETQFVQESLQARHGWTTRVAVTTLSIMLVLSGLTWFANSESVRANLNAAESKKNEGIAKKNEETAKSNARDANRQAAKASWQLGVIARDQNLGVKSAFHFLQAAQACEQAGEADDIIQKRNIELAAQFAVDALVRTLPHKYRNLGARIAGDESRVLTWSKDLGPGEVRLWDLAEAKLLQAWQIDSGAYGAVFTRDESRVLAWTQDGTIKLWDVTKAEPLQVWKHDRFVSGAMFTRDESRVLAWGGDGAVILWDVTKAEPLQVWKHDRFVSGAMFTRDESRVLAWGGGETGELKLWDVTKAEPIQIWKQPGDVNGAMFTRDESRVLAWGGNTVFKGNTKSVEGEVKLWDLNKAEPLQVWKHDRFVSGAMFTRDESRVLSWGGGNFEGVSGELKLWDVTKTEPLQVWKHPSSVNGAVFTRDESRVLTWGGDGVVRLWDVTKSDPLQIWKHNREVNGAVFSLDESQIIAWDSDGAVKIWDVRKSEPTQSWKHNREVAKVVYSRDESRVLAWGGYGAVILWDVTKAEPLQVWKHDGFVSGAVFTRDNSRVLSWSVNNEKGEVKLWGVSKSEPLQIWKLENSVSGAVFTRDESRVLAWGSREVKLLDVTKSEPVQVWNHNVNVFAAVFTRDESRVLAWGGREVKLLDVTKPEPLRVWKHEVEVEEALFTRDESRVLAWGGRGMGGRNSNGEVKIWDVAKSEPIQIWKQPGGVEGAMFTRDESRVLIWSGDRAVRLWDVTKSEPLQVWYHDVGFKSVLISRDDSRVLTWSNNGIGEELKLWDVTKSEPLQVWKHDGGIRGAIFTRDDSRVLSWSVDNQTGELKLWDVTKSEPLQVWKWDGWVTGAIFSRDETRVLGWGGRLSNGEVKLWDVTKSEPLQVWKHDSVVNNALFTRDESRILALSDRDVKLWDSAMRNPGLTPTERITELQVRSASRLDSAGQLVPMLTGEWLDLVSSSDYLAIQNKIRDLGKSDATK